MSDEKAQPDRSEQEKELNRGRTGKGTRVRVGMTRGRNPQPIKYEAFDESQTETLPATIREFAELTKTDNETVIVSYLIDGFNSAQYTAASDPIAEYLNPEWTDVEKTQFRTAIRNYSNMTGTSIEDSVALLKPSVEKALAKAKASAQASA